MHQCVVSPPKEGGDKHGYTALRADISSGQYKMAGRQKDGSIFPRELVVLSAIP